MYTLKELTDRFTQQSKNILGDNLTGIYLHGSAVMGCFNERKSDIDLLVIVKNDIPTDLKKQYLAMIYELNKEAPEKGIEMSVVKESVCDPFVYPTPFELHFSAGHLDWYRSDPDGYAEKTRGIKSAYFSRARRIQNRSGNNVRPRQGAKFCRIYARRDK